MTSSAVPEPPKIVRYQLTLDDYMAATRIHPSRKQIVQTLIFIGIAFALIGVLFVLHDSLMIALLFFVLAVLSPILTMRAMMDAAKKNYASMSSVLSQPLELTYGKGFVTYQTERTYARMMWFYQIIRAEQMRLLCLSNNTYWIVPVRVFDSHEALAEFDAICGQLSES
ncbi:MAG: hypothetical protein HUU46_16110 [Candidatus Hydrogenedentes bacterium]|nr:hypothetical protein [Candidatus Hydrogenedentota bacterium]